MTRIDSYRLEADLNENLHHYEPPMPCKSIKKRGKALQASEQDFDGGYLMKNIVLCLTLLRADLTCL